MRRFLTILFVTVLLTTLLTASAFAKIVFKFGVENKGDYRANAEHTTYTANLKSQIGYSLGLELLLDLGSFLTFGAGGEYQLYRKADGFDSYSYSVEDTFAFTPLYGVGRFNLGPVYLTGKAGYNMFRYKFSSPQPTRKPKGGTYLGLGGGAVLSDKYQLELLYSINRGKIIDTNDPNFDLRFSYSKICLSLGYLF